MKSLPRIGALCEEIDGHFDAELDNAVAKGDTAAAQRIEPEAAA